MTDTPSVPSVPAFLWPTVEAIRDCGGTATNAQIVVGVAAKMGLSSEQMQLPQPGHPTRFVAEYRAAWARTQLKRIGVISNDAVGVWSLTDSNRVLSAEQCLELYKGSLRLQRQQSLGARVWLVRANPEGRPLVDRWLKEGFVSLAAAHLVEVMPDASKADVDAAVQEGYEHVEYPQRRALTEDYYAFLSTMAEGDVVMARHDDQAWVGRITGEPELGDEAPRLRRTVQWMDFAVPTDELPSEAANVPVGPRLVIDLTVARGAIEALFDQETPVRAEADIVLARATGKLAADLNMPTEWLDEYIGLLESRRQVIVYGPPGTGKTYVARRIARHIAGDDGVSVVQFHPSYAYEDFFEGLRPYTTDANTVGYRVEPGPLRTLAATAASDSTRPYVLIVDEINRADIAKVFSELYYLLEYRGDRVTLQYSRDAFSLPKNLYIIGTMNTADRSIALVDAAIRRRFPFIEMHPSEEPVRSVLAKQLTSEGSSPYRAQLLAELNRRLGDGKLREFQIGPSYLMRPEAQTDEGLARIWRYEILPLLEEQLYGTYTRDQVHAEFGLDTIRQGIAPAQPDAAGGPTAIQDDDA